MISLLPPEMESLEMVPCPACSCKTAVRVVFLIHTEAQIESLIAGTINQSACPSCGGVVVGDGFVRIQMPGQLVPIIDRIPIGWLEEPSIREFLLWRDPDIPLVYTLGEMACIVAASLKLASHQEERRVTHRDIVVPQEILQRFRGSYSLAKLKTIWFVFTCFQEDYDYSFVEASRVISHALARLDTSRGFIEPSFIRSALCHLKLLSRSEDARIWRKSPQA
jgi:hypothetical protein